MSDQWNSAGEVTAALLGCWVIAFAGTWLVMRVAIRKGLVDVPNARSSHKISTPRGGGLAIVSATTLATLGLYLAGVIGLHFFIAFSGGGLAIALVGLADDRGGVSPRIRLCVHFAAALWALVWLGGVPPLRLGDDTVNLGWFGYVLGSVCIVWTVNLFNFMDGIDGIAASEAAFVAGAASIILLGSGAPLTLVALALAFCAANLGFLVWNWPPARIFLGDVGSGYLGYGLAVLAVSSVGNNGAASFVWLILGGVFFVDATVVVVRRWARGERVFEAHRTHGYQWLVRRWGSHKRVTLVVLGINATWLFPLACAAMRWPSAAGWITVGALVPLTIAAIGIGSGQREIESR